MWSVRTPIVFRPCRLLRGRFVVSTSLRVGLDTWLIGQVPPPGPSRLPAWLFCSSGRKLRACLVGPP
eukprot:7124825-Prorocentrum_lima.AAC.1